MPHRCMECKSVLESGELNLSTGCPVCGGKKFEYVRPQKKEPAEADLRKLTVAEYVAHAAVAEPEPPEKQPSEKHKRKEAPKHHAPKPPEEPKAKEKAHESRIDSVRILEKGNYDLNLPMLLNRKELVMSKEDGVYVVDLPSALKTAPKKKKKR